MGRSCSITIRLHSQVPLFFYLPSCFLLLRFFFPPPAPPLPLACDFPPPRYYPSNSLASFDGVGTAEEWLGKDTKHLQDYGYCTQIAIFEMKEGTSDSPHERYCPFLQEKKRYEGGEGDSAQKGRDKDSREYVLWGGEPIVLPCNVERRSNREVAIAECEYYYRLLLRERDYYGNSDDAEMAKGDEGEDWISVGEFLRYRKIAECCGGSKEALLALLVDASPASFVVDEEKQRVKGVFAKMRWRKKQRRKTRQGRWEKKRKWHNRKATSANRKENKKKRKKGMKEMKERIRKEGSKTEKKCDEGGEEIYFLEPVTTKG